MSVKLSTGFRDAIMTAGSVKAAIDGKVINVYDGTPPDTADAALSGNTLLLVISNDAAGTGITMDAASTAGVLPKTPSEIWRGLIIADGTATFYRFADLADDGLSSTVENRIQGSVGVAGADLNFSSTSFVSGNYKAIDSYSLALPTA